MCRHAVCTGGSAVSYDDDNIFARILRGEMPAHRIHEDRWTLAILDVMPQSDGHALVIPRAQATDLFDLDDEMAAAVMHTSKRIARALRQAFAPDGITLMQFNGAAAGQTVFHFHMHVVPRWADRPLRAHQRRMAEPALLEAHADRLRAALQALTGS